MDELKMHPTVRPSQLAWSSWIEVGQAKRFAATISFTSPQELAQLYGKGEDDGRAFLACDHGASLALAGMAEALQDYEFAFGFLPTAFRILIRELQQLAKRPTRTTVEHLLARRDRCAEPLTLLSRGAVSAGVLRRAADGEGGLEVKVNGGWIRPLGEQDAWLLALAVDSSSLKCARAN